MREVIDKYAGLPFRYGEDCCTFAGECVEALTGSNPMSRFSYSSEDEANEILDAYGGIEAAIRDVLGEPYEGHRDGDVCLIDSNDGRQAAAIIYRGRVVARVKGGLMEYPLNRALMIWKTKCRVS